MSVDAEAELIRADRARRARGNLAAVLVDRAGGLDVVAADGALVAQEFAELCDYLGLDQAPEQTAAGLCRGPGCDNELSLSGSASPTSGVAGGAARERGNARRMGFCSLRCKRRANLANQEGGG